MDPKYIIPLEASGSWWCTYQKMSAILNFWETGKKLFFPAISKHPDQLGSTRLYLVVFGWSIDYSRCFVTIDNCSIVNGVDMQLPMFIWQSRINRRAWHRSAFSVSLKLVFNHLFKTVLYSLIIYCTELYSLILYCTADLQKRANPQTRFAEFFGRNCGRFPKNNE